jgi:SAM-dependent methyltransferase
MPEPIVDDAMRAYYDARAGECDDWWLGRGLYADRDRPGWHEEVARVCEVVRDLTPGRVLDVACGTGFLTRYLRGDVVGLDQAPAMVEVAAARLPDARIVQGDAVPLPFADAEFDRVFTGHFLRPPAPRGAGAVHRRGPAGGAGAGRGRLRPSR